MTKSSTNGYGTKSDRRRLEQKLAELDADATAIRRVLAILNGEAVTKKIARADAVLQTAIGLDTVRVSTAGKRIGRPPNPGPKKYSRALVAQRRGTQKFLDWFDTTTPRRPRPGAANAKVGGMLRYGYLAQPEPGMYLRTDKPFVVQPGTEDGEA